MLYGCNGGGGLVYESGKKKVVWNDNHKFLQVLWESGVDAHACHTLKLMQWCEFNQEYTLQQPQLLLLLIDTIIFVFYPQCNISQTRWEKKGAICLFA